MENLFEKTIAINIEDEMKKSYMDYAMSVIIGRAIPDVRDGLKPVHRRVLFAMSEMGNRWNKPYKKSARIVGDIIGKYHPHGDTAAYDTMVRMAQDFSMRYLLVDGQGNFGSIDGDPPAAMRYTEVRMARIAEELLADLEKNTVNFVPNYDESLEEPTVLPAKIPLLLLNGTGGIAVGVATNIPPHNLREVIDGTIAMIRDPEITIDGLMHYIQGPDFPTAGFINGREGILSAYRTGRGIIRVRARALIEKNARNDRESIVVTELPYQVNKANLIEKIADLVKEKKIGGIADLRDESDREGIRVVLDLKRDEASAIVLNQLYKHTQMESTFGIIMLAIDRGQPRVFNLKEILQSFLEFRKQVVVRRTVFELAKARERAHILEGLIIALDRIDEVIAVIKASGSPAEAAAALCSRFGLSDLQAKAILEMRLQRLTGLEREKIDAEYAEISALIHKLQGILDDPQKVLDVIVEELTEIRARYGDERRTEIVFSSEEINIEDLIVEEDMVVTVSHAGYIKRNAVSLYKSQRRGGQGKIGMGTKEEDFVERIFIANTHHYVLIFTSRGRLYWLKVYLIPQAGRAAKGKAIVNLINLTEGERVAAVLPVREFTGEKSVVMVTRQGTIKKTELSAFSNPRAGGIIAISIDEGDELIDVQLTLGNQDIFLGTRKGKSIRFKEDDVRDMGRTARGVRGIRMAADDRVIGMEIPTEGNTILTVSEKGYGKRTEIAEYRLQTRGGKGTINLKTVPKVGDVSGILQISGNEDIMLISDAGRIIRMRAEEVRVIHRSTQGVRLIDLDDNEKLVGVARAEREEERENGAAPEDVPEEGGDGTGSGTGDRIRQRKRHENAPPVGPRPGVPAARCLHAEGDPPAPAAAEAGEGRRRPRGRRLQGIRPCRGPQGPRIAEDSDPPDRRDERGELRREPLRLRHRRLPAPDDGPGPSERRRGRSDPPRQRLHPRGKAREFHQQNGPPDPPRTAEDPLPGGRHERPDRRGDRLRNGEHRQGGPGELLHPRGLPAGPDRGQGLRGRRRGEPRRGGCGAESRRRCRDRRGHLRRRRGQPSRRGSSIRFSSRSISCTRRSQRPSSETPMWSSGPR